MRKLSVSEFARMLVIALLFVSASNAWTATESILHFFGSFYGDGSQPEGPLVMDAAGNFFGTTYVGSAFNAGTVYEITPSRKETRKRKTEG